MSSNTRRWLVSLALAAAVLVVGAEPLGAENRTSNPGFELNCGGLPCRWIGEPGATLVRDTVSAHTGSASLRVTTTISGFGARSECVTSFGSGTYEMSVWIRTTSAAIDRVRLRVTHFDSGDCSGGLTNSDRLVAIVADGNWQEAGFAMQIPPGTNSAVVKLEHTCAGSCAGTEAVNFDDVTVKMLNTVPNAGFTTDCSGVPCSWLAEGSPAVVTHDTTVFRSAPASLRLSSQGSGVGAISACITSAGSGTYERGFLYRTTSGGLSQVELTTEHFSSALCGGSVQSYVQADISVDADGAWHQVGVTRGTVVGNSMRLKLRFSGCAATCVVNFDDVLVRRTNPAPNPGFELDCTGIPCMWGTEQGAVVVRDTASPHSGAANIRVTSDTANIGAGSDCIKSLGTGTYPASFWYRTSSPGLSFISLNAHYYSDTACGALIGNSTSDRAANADGGWHPWTGEVDPIANTRSVRIHLRFKCAGACSGAKVVHYDDIALDEVLGPPTAASLTALSAKRVRLGVRVHWRTATETDLLGFNVWRAAGGGNHFVKVSKQLIRARKAGGARGASYRYVDRSARGGRAYVYKVELVTRLGASRWSVPARATSR